MWLIDKLKKLIEENKSSNGVYSDVKISARELEELVKYIEEHRYMKPVEIDFSKGLILIDDNPITFALFDQLSLVYSEDLLKTYNLIKSFLKENQAHQECEAEFKITENTSDGYHTFKELYEFRKLYNAGFFNELFKNHYAVHKSKKHNDGELCFGGNWFIVMAYLPDENGEPLQISNHYELKDWDLFKCEEKEVADKWDGHTSQDVIDRLNIFFKAK